MRPGDTVMLKQVSREDVPVKVMAVGPRFILVEIIEIGMNMAVFREELYEPQTPVEA